MGSVADQSVPLTPGQVVEAGPGALRFGEPAWLQILRVGNAPSARRSLSRRNLPFSFGMISLFPTG